MANDRLSSKRARLTRAVEGLPPDEYRVFVLSAAEGLSNEEIATRLGISAEAVEHLLASALVALDRALERQKRR